MDEEGPSSTLADAAAASVAARGVCFANQHPAPRRFLPLKAPSMFAAQRATATNKGVLAREAPLRWVPASGCGCARPPPMHLQVIPAPVARSTHACPIPALALATALPPRRCLHPVALVASELLPYVRTIHARTPDPRLAALLPPRWARYWQGQVVEERRQQHELGGMAQVADGGGEVDGAGGGASDEIEDSDDCTDDW